MSTRIRDILISIFSLCFVLFLWDFAVSYFKISPFLFPSPRNVAATLWEGYAGGSYWPHVFTTLHEMALGYVLGCSVALMLGAAVAEWRVIERLVLPYVIALQSMPKVALAPLLIVWFGFGIESKIALVALICFFPVIINSLAGLKNRHSGLIGLYRVFSASRLRIFLSVKVPSALASIFAGLQIAIVMSLIGAVVGEFLTSRQGLGFLIQNATLNYDVPTMFAAILSLAFIGLTGSAIVRYAHRKLAFWDQQSTAAGTSVATE